MVTYKQFQKSAETILPHTGERQSRFRRKGAEGRMPALFRNEKIQMLVVALGTAAAGEFKINPVPGDLFRIGLGGSAFLLFLLLMNRLPYIRTGIYTAVTVIVFRILLDHLFLPIAPGWLDSLRVHTSGGLYYLTFSAGMYLIQNQLERMNLLLLGVVATCIDFSSNTVEMILRWLLNGSDIFNPATWGYIALVAGLRGFFVTGLYSSIAVSQIRALSLEQNKRMEQMLSVNSGLYGEVFYLRKSMDTIERVTSSSYRLYTDLKKAELKDFSQRQLAITQEIHEVKKDSQRVAAGLLKLFDQDAQTLLAMSEILDYAIRGNRKYASMMQKQIVISAHLEQDFMTADYIPLLTLLNNLLANAIEALDHSGAIELRMEQEGKWTVFHVSDSGKGIPEKIRETIFEPGFTTKFGEGGSAATGIGLSHVHDIVISLGGSIALQSGEQQDHWNTVFVVKLPTEALKKGE
ncbi:ATP-binding protein [Paenibacillus sp. WLX1005]|uniref:ATP-binding protein n=1 Tax=Paenibacillus sp. WLX1005 TaxID=3243766 RepID=UPI003983F1A2